jgi:hypothetical protein
VNGFAILIEKSATWKPLTDITTTNSSLILVEMVQEHFSCPRLAVLDKQQTNWIATPSLPLPVFFMDRYHHEVLSITGRLDNWGNDIQ